MLQECLWVGVGGFIGSVLRYSVAVATRSLWASPYPIGTFAVNLIGCFFIGMISIAAQKYWTDSKTLVLFLSTGIVGGFTTFSAFGLETVLLAKNHGALTALLYVAASLTLGLGAVALGRLVII